MSKEEMAAFRARQKAAGQTEWRVKCTENEKAQLQVALNAIRAGKAIPLPGPATQTPATTPSPFSADHNMKTWRQYVPYLRPEQIARLESKEAKPTLPVPSERPLTEGLFGPMMTILWEPNQLVYQALTYLYENFMEHWESMKFNLNLSQTNGDRRRAALLIGVRPYIAPIPQINHIYIPPEGAELPDAPAEWYKLIGLKPPKRANHQIQPVTQDTAAPVPETPQTQQPTHIVNTQPTQPTPAGIIPEPWGDIELPIFS